jgi:hypothetical protein
MRVSECVYWRDFSVFFHGFQFFVLEVKIESVSTKQEIDDKLVQFDFQLFSFF